MVKKALKNKPKWGPSKGYSYLEDVKIGELVQTEFGTSAVLIDKGLGSTVVIVTDCTNDDLGKKVWALKTEVTIR